MARKEIRPCPHCGARMATNKYTMNMTLVRALAKMAKFPNRRAREIMDKSEYSVYTKLKHWGFARKKEDGLWEITPEGERFLRGDLRAVREITYFRDRVVDQSNDYTYIDGVFKTPESKQKYRDFMEGIL